MENKCLTWKERVHLKTPKDICEQTGKYLDCKKRKKVDIDDECAKEEEKDEYAHIPHMWYIVKDDSASNKFLEIRAITLSTSGHGLLIELFNQSARDRLYSVCQGNVLKAKVDENSFIIISEGKVNMGDIIDIKGYKITSYFKKAISSYKQLFKKDMEAFYSEHKNLKYD